MGGEGDGEQGLGKSLANKIKCCTQIKRERVHKKKSRAWDEMKERRGRSGDKMGGKTHIENGYALLTRK